MKKRNPKEQGQVIIILVAGIISLLGFTALAIDGARLFSERRTLQGVADTGALTAATFVGQYDIYYLDDNWYSNAEVEPHAEQAALGRIHSNGYTDPVYNPWGGNDRLKIEINPTEYVFGDDTKEPTEYEVEVFMISDIEPLFAQLVFDGDLLVNAQSHVKVRPIANIGFGQALYSLDPEDCKGIIISGSSGVLITGSGIYSSSSCTPDSIDITGASGGSIEGDLMTPGGVQGEENLTPTGNEDIVPGTTTFFYPPTPDCSGLPTSPAHVDVDANTELYYPGRYTTKMSLSNAKTYIFQPGLYCFEKGFLSNGGDSAAIIGHDVTFYVSSGDLVINSGAFDLTAPKNGEADDGTNSWDGMLFYVDGYSVNMRPSPGSYFEGTIFGPSDKNDPACVLNGNGDTAGYNIQFVCDKIALIGNAELLIDFDNTNAYDPPVNIDLTQ